MRWAGLLRAKGTFDSSATDRWVSPEIIRLAVTLFARFPRGTSRTCWMSAASRLAGRRCGLVLHLNDINKLRLEKVRRQTRALRHLHIANPKTGPSRGLFLYVPKGLAGTIRPSETAQPREIGLRAPSVSFHPPCALGETELKSDTFQ